MSGSWIASQTAQWPTWVGTSPGGQQIVGKPAIPPARNLSAEVLTYPTEKERTNMPPLTRPKPMNVALRRPWATELFLAWEENQALRHEFDGFQPIALVGGTA
jgi:hypothetical protein